MNKKVLMLMIVVSIAVIPFINNNAYSQPYRASYSDNAAVARFYNELMPYGRWIHHSVYGWVWSPSGVSGSWRPYTEGHWTHTEYGWTWVSDEPWGLTAFHYGRWFKDGFHGWLWYPGSEWAPAWVVWRYDDDMIGWAPLSPDVPWAPDYGPNFAYVRFDDFIPVTSYTFIEIRYFTRPVIISYIIHDRHNEIFRRTRPYADYRDRHQGYVRNSLPIHERIERHSGQRIKTVSSNEVKIINRVQSERVVTNIEQRKTKSGDKDEDTGRFQQKSSTPAPTVVHQTQVSKESEPIKETAARLQKDLKNQNERNERKIKRVTENQPRRVKPQGEILTSKSQEERVEKIVSKEVQRINEPERVRNSETKERNGKDGGKRLERSVQREQKKENDNNFRRRENFIKTKGEGALLPTMR